jgi:pseudouridine-5'-phosphate glycosidase
VIFTMNHPYLDIHPEVAQALAERRPVVALESTIISHGMPYPQNVATALQVEAEVRAHGAVPATIAIIGGRLKAGLSADEIEALGRAGHGVAKVSRRDMPFIVSAGAMGATTVAATMLIAAMAGIRVFATGGIGGVHRGAQQSFDISADLQELARTPVAVVCAGAKSILDLGLTLEYLETHGVPVVGYRTPWLPAFFTRESPFKVDYQLDSAEAIAAALHAKWAMGLDGGVVVANPIPQEHAMPPAAIDAAVALALLEAAEQGISGKASTPFLLARVCEITGGDSLASNIQLVLNNARLAAGIAAAYTRLGQVVESQGGL